MTSISILYEDDDVLVIDKPTGLLVHGDGRNSDPTLCDWILEHYPDMADVGEDQKVATGDMVPRPGIVHRLDKDTSGVLVLCKTEESFLYTKQLFQNRDVKKIYKAFVYENIKEEEGIIDAPIGRSPKDFRRYSAESNARGELRDAVTEWKKIVSTKSVAFLEVAPQTGRTHQIRVHLKHIGHAVVGDPLYAPDRTKLLGFERLALHAHRIMFKTVSGVDIEVTAPYPPDFDSAILAIEDIAKAEIL